MVNNTNGAVGLFSVGQYVYSWCGLSNFKKAPSDTCYSVSVSTVALSKAVDFDGEVYLKVYGDQGVSEEMRLQNWWSSSFSPGSSSSFYVSSANVGIMTAVVVRTVGRCEREVWRPLVGEVWRSPGRRLSCPLYENRENKGGIVGRGRTATKALQDQL